VHRADPSLQEGKQIPEWNPRSRLGMYLGNSPVHSSTVSRVLNPRTGYTTAHRPQWWDSTWSFDPRTLEQSRRPRLRPSRKFNSATVIETQMANRESTPGPRRGSDSSTSTTDTPGPRGNRQSWRHLDEVGRSASRAPDNKPGQRDECEYLE
jgi:hypothetical protein